MNKVLVLNGPNLNLLGTREKNHYGNKSLNDINNNLSALAKQNNCYLEFFQNNHEGLLIDRIHQAKKDNIDAMIINLAAYTHTSIALRDALLAVDIKFIEVHISNIFQRENYRHKSFVGDIALGTITGLGTIVYELALRALLQLFNETADI